MHRLRRLTRQHALFSALALVVALWVSAGWGQVHRVLHPQGDARAVSAPGEHARADAGVGGAAPDASKLGHEHGSSLCKLLDHLGQPAGGVSPAVLVWLQDLRPAMPVHEASRPARLALRPFDARAPPRLG